MKSEELRELLGQCYGTNQYYYMPPFKAYRYTDGVKLFCTKAEAYWFLTDLFCLFRNLKGEEFLNICLDVKEDNTAELTIDDGNGKVLFYTKYGYTDCPKGQWRFYFVDNVLMIPNEY